MPFLILLAILLCIALVASLPEPRTLAVAQLRTDTAAVELTSTGWVVEVPAALVTGADGVETCMHDVAIFPSLSGESPSWTVRRLAAAPGWLTLDYRG